jgi:hypothetical protein
MALLLLPYSIGTVQYRYSIGTVSVQYRYSIGTDSTVQYSTVRGPVPHQSVHRTYDDPAD